MANHVLFAQAAPTTSATVVVAASDSKQSSKDNADYVCDGTADEVEIENALADLATAGSGEVVLMEGTYDIDDTINIDTELTGIRFMPGARIKWDGSGTAPLISIDKSNTYLTYPRVEGSSEDRTHIGILVGGAATVHGVQIYSPACRYLDVGIEFGIVGGSSSGDNQTWGGRIDNCNTGIASKGFVNRVYAIWMSNVQVGIHCTADRSSQKIEVYGATISEASQQGILVERGKDSIFHNIWLANSDDNISPTEMIEIGKAGSPSYEVYNCTFSGNTNLHMHDEDHGVRLVNSRGLRFENMLVSTNDYDDTAVESLIAEESTSSGLDNRFGRITFYPGNIPDHTVLDKDGSGEVIVEMPPDVSGSAPGTTVGHVAPPGEADYLIVRQGDSYYAKQSNGHVPLVTETLKDLLDEIKASNNYYLFAPGTFDFGTVATSGDRMIFDGRDNMRFEGAGIGVTLLQNYSTLSTDTEIFKFTNCEGIIVRNMSVKAQGSSDDSSDAINGNNTNDCLIENVEVLESRGCGITFDGKNEGAEARRNRIVGCRITGCGSHGIKILRAHHTVVDGCIVYGNGEKGIIIEKAQDDADQPNAPSEYNVVTNCQVFENDQQGIYIRSSHYNQITDNTVQNNGQGTGYWDGIRVIADDGIDAIGNIIRGNVCTDDQGTGTQAYGVKLIVNTTGAVDYTIVSDNDLRGNVSGALSDGGTNTLASNNAQ